MGYDTDTFFPIDIDVLTYENLSPPNYIETDPGTPAPGFLNVTTSRTFNIINMPRSGTTNLKKNFTTTPIGDFDLWFWMNISSVSPYQGTNTDGMGGFMSALLCWTDHGTYAAANTAHDGIALQVFNWGAPGVSRVVMILRDLEPNPCTSAPGGDCKTPDWVITSLLNQDLQVNLYRDSSQGLIGYRAYNAAGTLLQNMSRPYTNTTPYNYFLPVASYGGDTLTHTLSGTFWDYHF